MNTWSFVNAAGRFTGRTFTGPRCALAANTPNGCTAVEGLLDQPVVDPLAVRERVQARIDQLERRQLRPQRELLIDPSNTEARSRLAEIDAQIAALRAAV